MPVQTNAGRRYGCRPGRVAESTPAAPRFSWRPRASRHPQAMTTGLCYPHHPDGPKSGPNAGRRSVQIAEYILILLHHLSEPLVNEGVGDPEPIGDQLHTVLQPLKLLGTAGRVDLLRRAPQHDEAAQIATGRVKNGHVKTFDPAFLLKAPVVLQRVVVDVKGALLTPARNLSPPNEQSSLSHDFS